MEVVSLKEIIFIASVQGIGGTSCSSTVFPISNWTRATNLRIDRDMCLNKPDLFLTGDFYSTPHSYIEVLLARCRGSSCVTNINDIYTFYQEASVDLLALESYYDESDLANPIKQYINTAHRIEANYDIYTEGRVQVRENEVVFLNGTKKTFYDTLPIMKSNL